MQTEILGTTGSQYWTFKVVVTEDENGILTLEAFLGRSATAGSSYFQGTYTLDYNCGGQEFSEELYRNSGTIPAGGWYSIGYHTFDETDSDNVEIEVSLSTTSFSPYNASASGNVSLVNLGILRIGNNNEWKKAKVYFGINNEWKKCKPYFGVSGVWKKGK